MIFEVLFNCQAPLAHIIKSTLPPQLFFCYPNRPKVNLRLSHIPELLFSYENYNFQFLFYVFYIYPIPALVLRRISYIKSFGFFTFSIIFLTLIRIARSKLRSGRLNQTSSIVGCTPFFIICSRCACHIIFPRLKLLS